MQPKAMLYFLPMLLAALLPLPAVAQTTHIVTVGDNFFSPANLTIQVGDTVEWRNAAGGNPHNVTADDGSFASGTSSSFTFSFTFNSPGSTDYTCTVHPAQMQGTITVEGAGGDPADLAVQSVDATGGTYAPGDAIPIAISIQNVGNEASGSFSVSYYASTDANITGADTSLGSDNRASLGAGAVANFAANAAFPGSMPEGSYFIGAIIDINDANNANNTGVDNSPVTVEAPAQADLALNEVSAPSGSFPQGVTISVDAEVENIGDAASGPFSIDYYASANTSITTQDRLLGTENRPSLGAGQDSSGPFDVMIPGNLAPGTYFIGAIIDINDANNANDVNHDNEALTVTEAAGNGFVINEGLNDSWFNPATGGQGFFITVFPDIEMMFLAWFTYDTERPPQDAMAMLGEAGHRWLTAFGPYAGDTAMLAVELTQGGVFDSPEPAPTQGPDGTITVVFEDCNTGVVMYDITSAQVSGEVPIRRIANDNIPFCESLAAQ